MNSPEPIFAPQSGSSSDLEPSEVVAAVEALGDRLRTVRERIGRVIFGQSQVVDHSLITLLGGGHALLIGVPGLAKTLLVETLGAVLALDAKRIQCTPDLMPADILGSEVLEESETGRRSFRFIAGPVFCQLLMADEINRASPRTNRPSCRRCRSIAFRSPGHITRCRNHSMSWRHRTRWSRKGPTRYPKRSSIAF